MTPFLCSVRIAERHEKHRFFFTVLAFCRDAGTRQRGRRSYSTGTFIAPSNFMLRRPPLYTPHSFFSAWISIGRAVGSSPGRFQIRILAHAPSESRSSSAGQSSDRRGHGSWVRIPSPALFPSFTAPIAQLVRAAGSSQQIPGSSPGGRSTFFSSATRPRSFLSLLVSKREPRMIGVSEDDGGRSVRNPIHRDRSVCEFRFLLLKCLSNEHHRRGAFRKEMKVKIMDNEIPDPLLTEHGE